VIEVRRHLATLLRALASFGHAIACRIDSPLAAGIPHAGNTGTAAADNGFAANIGTPEPVDELALAEAWADDMTLRQALHAALWRYSPPEKPGEA
jgi:hypothetical protein